MVITSGTDCVRAGVEGYKLGSPLGGLAIASYLRALGVPVQHVDLAMDRGIPVTAEAQRRVFARLADELAVQAARIAWIGLSMLASTDDALVLGPVLRAALPGTPIILGGYHPSSCWQKLVVLDWSTGVVVGDGEHASERITANLAAGRPIGHDVPNLRTRHQQEGPASRAVPIEDVPPLNLALLAHPDRYPTLNLPTSRGCPWRCSFCLEQNMRSYRSHSIGWMATQLESAAAAAATRRVYLADPLFGVGEGRLVELCEVLRAAPFRYAASTRVDVIAPTQVPRLAAAGVDALYVGVESASPEALVRMNKVKTVELARRYLERAFEFFAALFESDVTPVVGFLFGYPGDTEEDYRRCVEFVARLRHVYDSIGGRAGFATVGAERTEVYDSSVLVSEPLPAGARLGPEVLTGLRVVEQASTEVDRHVVDRYQERRQELHLVTELARSRLGFFGGYPVSGLIRERSPAFRDGVLYPPELDRRVAGP